MAGSKMPWVIKYRPKKVDDVVNQEEAKSTVLTWIHSWLEGKRPTKKALLLYGPPGVGKTSLVESIASEYDLELLELNASDYRRTQDIRKTVAVASQKKPLFKKMIIILMDEVDGLSPRSDAGGIEELMKIIPNSINPIILTANDPWKDSLRPLREYVTMVQFKQLTTNQIIAVLQNICNKEKIQCDREALKFIAEKSLGDVRGAINDLEAVAEGYGRVTFNIVSLVVKPREKNIDLWRTLNSVFYAREFWQARKAVNTSEEDYETLMAWINDNIPAKYEDPEDVFRAWDSLARASIFLKRAKSGNWFLLPYIFDLIGPGVSFARKNGQVLRNRFSYPAKIKEMAQLKSVRENREGVARTIAKRIHASKRIVKSEVLPYLFLMMKYGDINRVSKLSSYYSFTEDQLRYLAGSRVKEIISSINREASNVKETKSAESSKHAAKKKRRSRSK
ncbi:MAG: replication factor C large subunit [Caldisphaeraceae archaeon]|nr:replication factor C large subunit [Caldisphaeraceae archaeon]